ncbi:MAG: DMT family transporter [Anaerolineales bacterium]|nr:DMT family transporter [Anaerolineales bacterium]
MERTSAMQAIIKIITVKGKQQAAGITAALSSAFFLGLAPVFGRKAILLGFSPFAVVALRTSIAALLLLAIVTLFKRSYLYIFSVGLLGCILAGLLNGVGSILYYMALGRLNASVGQLLYSVYPLFVAIGFALDGQPPSRLTLYRLLIAGVAVILLTKGATTNVDALGVLLMLGGAFLYAVHLPINQRVLYEAPAVTVTLYTMIAMSAVVVPAYFIFDRQIPASLAPWGPVLGLTLVTFLSRLALFMGVKRIGGMQTALLGLGELLITITLSYLWLGEKLSWFQWVGAIALTVSLLLVKLDAQSPERKRSKSGWLGWIRPPDMDIPSDIPWSPHD